MSPMPGVALALFHGLRAALRFPRHGYVPDAHGLCCACGLAYPIGNH